MYSIFSILKMTLMEKESIDISGYSELTFFLKCMAEGYKPKKAEVLSDQNMSDFLHFANDEKYLCCKIILIFGIAGGCRNAELKQIRFSDVEEHGQMYRVKIPLCKTEYSRTFFIYEEFFPIVKKYIDLRPKELSQENSRFLLNYQNGRCTKQVNGYTNFFLRTYKFIISKFLINILMYVPSQSENINWRLHQNKSLNI